VTVCGASKSPSVCIRSRLARIEAHTLTGISLRWIVEFDLICEPIELFSNLLMAFLV
jgi:hypothetical protein